jgi:hypothetical protein
MHAQHTKTHTHTQKHTLTQKPPHTQKPHTHKNTTQKHNTKNTTQKNNTLTHYINTHPHHIHTWLNAKNPSRGSKTNTNWLVWANFIFI